MLIDHSGTPVRLYPLGIRVLISISMIYIPGTPVFASTEINKRFSNGWPIGEHRTSGSVEHIASEKEPTGFAGSKLLLDSSTNMRGVKSTDQSEYQYRVRRGDSLRSISLKNTGTDQYWKLIADYNNIGRTTPLLVDRVVSIPRYLIGTFIPIIDSGLRKEPTIEKTPIDALATEGLAEIYAVHPNSKTVAIASSSPERPVPLVDRVRDSTLRTKAPLSSDFAVNRENIDMFAGEVKVFDKLGVKRVAVGNGAIIRAEVLSSGELLTIAQSAGSSSLRLWHEDGSQSDFNIRVSVNDPETRIRPERMIRLRVKMVEFRKSALSRLGIDWGDSMEGPVIATAGDMVSNTLFRPIQDTLNQGAPLAVRPFSSFFGIATQLSSRINFMLTNGDAEMLAEPVLSCRNGGSAKFLAGGEVPYPSIGLNGQTAIDFKEYGIRLEVSPVVDNAGAIQASILTEISSIDPSVTVQGAPGLLTRRTQTEVNANTGDTIVIAGLLQSDVSKDIDRLPGIGKLPVIGKLFRSENVRKNVSELVIFITPEVVEPKLSAQTQGYLNKATSTERRAREILLPVGGN